MGQKRFPALASLFLFLAAASLAVKTPAQAYIPQDDQYLCDFPESLKVYRYWRWFPEELPLKVYLPNPPFKTEQPEMYQGLVQQAFLSWTAVAPAFRFQWVANPKDAQIKVVWFEHFPDSENMWGEASLPLPYLTAENQVRHKSEVHLAVQAQEGTGLTAGHPFFGHDELLAIAIHEVGHALGLPHSKSSDDIMSQYLFRLSAQNQWQITTRDAATLRRLYSLPRNLKISPCNG